MFTLRPYQEQFIDDIRHEFAIGKRRVCAVAPCGSGKTVMAGWMARGALVRGRRVLFMVHRKELIEQTSRAFQRLGINHSLILKGARVVDDSPVHIASVQTLSRRLDKLQPPDFLLCDECHHIMAGTYQKILTAFPKAYVLGLTATPTRLNGSGLGSVFESLVLGATVKELIAEGNLAPYDYYAPPTKFDPKLARVRYGEYVKSDVAAQIDDAMIIGDVVKNYKKYADGKRAIVYCISREHSEHIAAAFQKKGIAMGIPPRQDERTVLPPSARGKSTCCAIANYSAKGLMFPRLTRLFLRARQSPSRCIYSRLCVPCAAMITIPRSAPSSLIMWAMSFSTAYRTKSGNGRWKKKPRESECVTRRRFANAQNVLQRCRRRLRFVQAVVMSFARKDAKRQRVTDSLFALKN